MREGDKRGEGGCSNGPNLLVCVFFVFSFLILFLSFKSLFLSLSLRFSLLSSVVGFSGSAHRHTVTRGVRPSACFGSFGGILSPSPLPLPLPLSPLSFCVAFFPKEVPPFRLPTPPSASTQTSDDDTSTPPL